MKNQRFKQKFFVAYIHNVGHGTRREGTGQSSKGTGRDGAKESSRDQL